MWDGGMCAPGPGACLAGLCFLIRPAPLNGPAPSQIPGSLRASKLGLQHSLPPLQPPTPHSTGAAKYAILAFPGHRYREGVWENKCRGYAYGANSASQ
jgi:hypothetical protein